MDDYIAKPIDTRAFPAQIALFDRAIRAVWEYDGRRFTPIAVRAGVAFDAAGQPDSAAAAFAEARAGGKLASIDTWLRVRQDLSASSPDHIS